MAQPLSVTLTPSDHNGFAISCFGEKDGSLTAQITGGVPPYRFGWSTGEEESLTISELPAGYYIIKVVDDVGDYAYAEIMLLEPNVLKVGLTPVVYPNDYNISCWECHNGMIYVDVYGGTAPFNYVWNDGLSGYLRMGLGAKQHYSVEVTDANGCVAKTQKINLTQPERNDWGMMGNTGSDANVHYIGTADAQDVVFKSNGQEVVRITQSGKLKLTGSTEGIGVLMLEADGTLRGGGAFPEVPPMPVGPCGELEVWPFWETDGNNFNGLCEGEPRLGTISQTPLSIITGDVQQMRIATNGQTQLYGVTSVAADDVNPFLGFPSRLNVFAADGQWLRMSTGTDKHWRIMPTVETPEEGPGMRFHFTEGSYPPTQGLGPLALFENGGVRAGSSLRVLPNGKVSIGDVNTNTPDHGYMLYVEGGLLTEKVKVALKTSNEWSDHVFEPGYELMPLPEVKTFIEEHGHLPGVPSAEQMVEHGLDVVKTDALLLEKIEEITLHLIRMEERVEVLEKENSQLRLLVGKH